MISLPGKIVTTYGPIMSGASLNGRLPPSFHGAKTKEPLVNLIASIGREAFKLLIVEQTPNGVCVAHRLWPNGDEDEQICLSFIGMCFFC